MMEMHSTGYLLNYLPTYLQPLIRRVLAIVIIIIIEVYLKDLEDASWSSESLVGR